MLKFSKFIFSHTACTYKIYENLHHTKFPAVQYSMKDVILNSSTIEHRANLSPSWRPITHFTLELERYVHDHATPTKNEKLLSKGIAMHVYSFSIYYA